MKPRIIVVCEGGCVTAVFCSVPADCSILDHDEPGEENDELLDEIDGAGLVEVA